MANITPEIRAILPEFEAIGFSLYSAGGMPDGKPSNNVNLTKRIPLGMIGEEPVGLLLSISLHQQDRDFDLTLTGLPTKGMMEVGRVNITYPHSRFTEILETFQRAAKAGAREVIGHLDRGYLLGMMQAAAQALAQNREARAASLLKVALGEVDE